MFLKYVGQFGKAEAEWALEVLDMHDGDATKALSALGAAVERIIAHRKGAAELTEFERAVDAACFASPNWWPIGMARLRELGRIPA